MSDEREQNDVPVEDEAASRGVAPEDLPAADESDEKLKDALGVEDDEDSYDEYHDDESDFEEVGDDTAPETTDDLESPTDANVVENVEDETGVPASEQQAVFASQAEVPPDLAPGGPTDPESLEQRLERASGEHVGDPEPQPVEALEQRKQENREAGAEPLPGSAEERQRDGASEASARTPLLQRPAEEQSGEPTNQNPGVRLGDTLPGERSLENDEPGFEVAVNHVPGTPLPEAVPAQVNPHPPTGLEDYQRIHDEAVAAREAADAEDGEE